MKPWAKRCWIGLLLGLGAIGSCAGVAHEDGAAALDPSGDGWISAGKGSPARPDAGDCPHGRLEDPHRGFVRCLRTGEADAGWLPPPPQPPPPVDGGADAAPPDAAPPDAAPPGDAGPDTGAPAPLPLVEIGAPSFINGDVPNVDKKLRKLADRVAKCVAAGGGLSGRGGSIKLQFLVRSRGRAEGVEILKAKGVAPAAGECIRLLLKNRAVGAPTADPVGVTVTISLKPGR